MLNLKAYSDTLFRIDEVLNDKLYNISLNPMFLYQPNDINKEALKATFEITTDNEALLNEPLKNYFFEGTFYYLELHLKELYETITLKEWHEYNSKPYHFKIEIETSKTGINEQTLLKTDEIVNRYKNVRSIYEGATLKLATTAKTSYKSLIQTGESIQIAPLQVTDITTQATPHTATAFKFDEIISI